MSRYENWEPERIEEYRRKNREKIKQRRLEKGRDRAKENASRRERYKNDPEFKKKRQEEKKKWYLLVDKTSPEYLEKSQKANQILRNKRMSIKKQCISYLGDKCLNCKQEFHPNVYDFHHKDPNEKENNIALLFNKERFTMTEKLKAELDKCQLLCANCHRLVHVYIEE